MLRCACRCWTRSASATTAQADHAPARIVYSATRRTPHARSARTCAGEVSPASSPNPTTRKATGSGEARPAVGRSPTTRSPTGRNVVERAFNLIKNWRALATRYDKHAVIYRGGIVLAADLMWLRQ